MTKLLSWCSFAALRMVAFMFRFLPFRGLYVLSDLMTFLLFRVVGYRGKVVINNLRRVFPEKNEAELNALAYGSYRNLCDITLETIKSFSMSQQERWQHCPIKNPELVNAFLEKGQSVIISGSHYNNWELACLTIPMAFSTGQAVTVYKPLSNKIMDAWMNQNRAQGGMIMTDMNTVFGEMRRRKGQPTAWFLVSDQSPSSPKSAHWVSFLGQESASLPGVDVLARAFDYPVLYFHLNRLKRGYYELEYEMLWPNPGMAKEMDITKAYAKMAETAILTQPENWLWSHKRWKINKKVLTE